MSANELASLVGGWAALTTSMMLLLGTIFGVCFITLDGVLELPNL